MTNPERLRELDLKELQRQLKALQEEHGRLTHDRRKLDKRMHQIAIEHRELTARIDELEGNDEITF